MGGYMWDMCCYNISNTIQKHSKNEFLCNGNVYSFKYKILCFSRTQKNNKYFISRLTADDIDKLKVKDAEQIIYSESLRRSRVSLFTIIYFLIGSIYWYLIPDLFKFLLIKLVVEPLRQPCIALSKQWILFNVSLDARLNNGKVPFPILFYRMHEKEQVIKIKNYRLQLIIAHRIKKISNYF